MSGVRVLADDEVRASHVLFRSTLHRRPMSADQWEFARDSFESGRTLGAFADGRMIGTALAWSSDFAVLSDGTKVAAPKFLRRAARRLRRLQQDLSRKRWGSQNRRKAVVKVARAHARVADTRRDWQHKLSTAIIRDNQAVYVEDLCVAGLGRSRLAKSVHDAGWASFTTMLEYKAARYGRTFARVGRFFPSTRMCSDCGRVTDRMALSIRSWVCPCGSHHDRDHNAAKNVLAAGQADKSNDRGARVRPAAMPAPRGEAVTHPDAARSARSVEGTSALLGRRGCQRISSDDAIRCDGPAAVTVGVEVLSMLYLGTWTWSALAEAGRVTVADPAALPELDRLFAVDGASFTGTGF